MPNALNSSSKAPPFQYRTPLANELRSPRRRLFLIQEKYSGKFLTERPVRSQTACSTVPPHLLGLDIFQAEASDQVTHHRNFFSDGVNQGEMRLRIADRHRQTRQTTPVPTSSTKCLPSISWRVRPAQRQMTLLQGIDILTKSN